MVHREGEKAERETDREGETPSPTDQSLNESHELLLLRLVLGIYVVEMQDTVW